MDRLRQLEVFVAVAEAGGLARAAARLRLSPPAVTRALAALEDRLGARLFNRTTRSLAITETGRRHLEAARRILHDLDTAEREAAGETATVQGHLTITAPVTFGRQVLAPMVCAFLGAHARVTASLLLLDRVANLVDEGIDLAVRIGPLPDSGLIARRVGAVHRVLVASPAYLARRGTPQVPADLRDHAVIAFTGLMPGREWRLPAAQGHGGVTLAPAFEINDALAAIEAAEAGHGITLALSYMVHDRIADGRLVAVPAGSAPQAQPVHLVHPQGRVVAPRVRAFTDYAAPRLRTALDRLGPAPGHA